MPGETDITTDPDTGLPTGLPGDERPAPATTSCPRAPANASPAATSGCGWTTSTARATRSTPRCARAPRTRATRAPCGGISATALDEVMGWSAILLADVWAATATMDLRYRKQVPLDVPLRLVAGLKEARPRRLRAWARLELPDGSVAVEATGLLVSTRADGGPGPVLRPERDTRAARG